MGSWDCYCAICGGPFCQSPLAEKPRSSRFLRRHGLSQHASSKSAQSNQFTGGDPEGAKVEADNNKVVDSGSGEGATAEDREEDGSFDPNVISQSMTAWMEDLHILREDTDKVTGENFGCVSGVGKYLDSVRVVDIEAGNDPNFDPKAEIVCYDGSFPFHWCCFELLGRVLEGNAGINGLNKSQLWKTMFFAHPMFSSRLDRLDYGNPGPANNQYWTTEAGKEFIVVHPKASLKRTTGLIRDKLTKSIQIISPSNRLRRADMDVFHKLPLELLSKICNMLDPRSLFQWAMASPTVDVFLEDKQFWKLYLSVNMPWSFELLTLFNEGSQETLHKIDYKSLFVWVDQESTPGFWMRGPFMSIANRRRIWHVCEQIKTVYSGRSARFPPTKEEQQWFNKREAQAQFHLQQQAKLYASSDKTPS